MKNLLKRMFALLLVLAMIGSLIPAPSVQGAALPKAESDLLTDQDYQAADAVFAQIDQMEENHAKKNLSETELADAAAAVVVSSDSYVDGSLDRNGNFFTWWTTDGVRCVYSPRMRQIQDEMVAPSEPEAAGAYNVPGATKGSTSTEVFLVGPYYGVDSNFTNQYKNEAANIARAIGDTDGYTLYSGTAATVDAVANAMSKGAVVIFDSHGDTDYINPNDEYDFVTGAENSYLCLTSTTGLTSEDYADGALYYSDGICINGATIANHMTSNNPGGILWMAICLGMATSTMCQPMRDMGVEVVYGYSQSVTFDGDYLYEECFWDNMCSGTTVAAAVADMKETFGCWDMSQEMYDYYGWEEDEYGPFYNLEEARYYTCAFPIVVSDEDTHPGQRNGSFYGADSLQTVKSTYKLNITGTGSSGSDNTVVTDPTAGTAYKLYMDKNGTRLYFNGQTESAEVTNRLGTTTNKAEAVDVYLEETFAGCRLYFYNGGVKTYIRVYAYMRDGEQYPRGSLELTTQVPAEILTYNSQWNTLVYQYDQSNSFYMGTYGTYTTFSVSSTYYITGNNAGYIDISQFPARLEAVDGGTVQPTEPAPTVPIPSEPVSGGEGVVQISFADTSARVSLNTERQVWQQNGITVTNDKGASSSNVADYSNPARFYKNSTLTIEYPGMTKIVVDSVTYNDNDYTGYLVETVNSAADGNAIAHAVEDEVTILFANPVNSYSVVLTAGQVRAYEMYVYSGFAGEVTPTEPTPSNPRPTEPTPSDPAGVTAYKLYMDKNGTKLYFNGQTESAEVAYRLATTTNKAEAVDVYLEEASGGYRLYFMNGSAKTYIRVYERTDGDPGYGKGSLELVTSAPAEVLTVDDITGTLIYTADADNSYYMGTYNDFTTFSVSNTYYITGDNAANVDVSQYPARLEEVAGSVASVPVITLQPVDQTVLEGKTAQFTVKATGEGLQYQWQYRTSAAGSWENASATGNKTATLNVSATASRNQYQYRCQVADQYGNVINSKAATLKVVTLKITTQPANNNVPAGKTAKFTVKAVGEGLKYQWQYRISTTGAWKNASATGNKTAALSVPATAARNGYQYRCKITDKYGNVINSKVATLRIVTLKVTAQPVSKYLPAGKTAKFTVKASGSSLKYQWQYRTSAKGSWKTASATGSKTATLSVPVTAARNGYQYRCKITDKYGNVIYSNAATLKTVTLKITTQPSSVTLATGKTATFKVVAKGTGLTYQWQYRTSAKGSWKRAAATGNKTATLKVPVTAARNGYQYRCVITDRYGNVINSSAATLKIK